MISSINKLSLHSITSLRDRHVLRFLAMLAILCFLESIVYYFYGHRINIEENNPRLTIEEAKEYINKNSDITIIDVRSSYEFSYNVFKKSINIPLFKLYKNYNQIAESKPVLIVDLYGARATQAYKLLRRLRPDLHEIHYVRGRIFDLPDAPTTPAALRIFDDTSF